MITALPTYAMHTTALPRTIVASLERLHRNFLWGGQESQVTIHPISWSQVCTPRHEGDLGIRPLASVNLVSLAKLAWRFLKCPEALWSQVLLGKYGGFQHLRNGRLLTPCSLVWRGLEKGFMLLREGLAGAPPHLSWKMSSQGLFTMRSAYSLLHRPGDPPQPAPWNSIWKLLGPPRRSLLLWLSAHDRLKTSALLWQLRCLPSPICGVCHSDEESTLHALRDCSRATAIWWLLLSHHRCDPFWDDNSPSNWIAGTLIDGPLLLVRSLIGIMYFARRSNLFG